LAIFANRSSLRLWPKVTQSKALLYYKGDRGAVTGPDSAVRWPPNSTIIDYELEIACVIGAGDRDIAAAVAQAHIVAGAIGTGLASVLDDAALTAGAGASRWLLAC
jgi:2-keto-4-pentenoate hydratase/2-oxohepta-3-ene-1,7-dioic acid hydratase in catechol pathway